MERPDDRIMPMQCQALLYYIFPHYPDLHGSRPIPKREKWAEIFEAYQKKGEGQ